jgi:hypothetical protein
MGVLIIEHTGKFMSVSSWISIQRAILRADFIYVPPTSVVD